MLTLLFVAVAIIFAMSFIVAYAQRINKTKLVILGYAIMGIGVASAIGTVFWQNAGTSKNADLILSVDQGEFTRHVYQDEVSGEYFTLEDNNALWNPTARYERVYLDKEKIETCIESMEELHLLE